jgi:hypothetical protein
MFPGCGSVLRPPARRYQRPLFADGINRGKQNLPSTEQWVQVIMDQIY